MGARLKGHFQLTTDGLDLYLNATDEVLGVEGKHVVGKPDPDKISTSHVERQNLPMGIGMRRFTRLTNGFSKKVENLTHAVSVQYMLYNFAHDPTPAWAMGSHRRWPQT